MPLPRIPKKQFEVKSKFLPKGKVSLVPFSVGQHDYVIQVRDSEDEKEKIAAIKQIVQECIVTEGVDVGSIPMFIIEEIFLRLVQNSAGELIPLTYECKNTITNPNVLAIDKDGYIQKQVTDECNTRIQLDLDTREFKIVESEGHTNKIVISPPIGIVFRYPSINVLENIEDTKDEIDVILACIDMIFDDENVYPASEQPKEELLRFWNEQTLAQKKEVYEKFFSTIPHLHFEKEVVCPKCGFKHKIEFNSLMEAFS